MSVESPASILVDGRPSGELPLRHIWNECIGAGRANEALRADWQRHFQEAVTVLGARYVRFHGVFHDDMFVYRASDGGGFGPPTPLAEPVYTFAYVDKVFDAILDAGARPFVELGFMPRELATQTETLFWWKAHCSPPKDMGAWVALVTATIEHWIDRYGIDEVRTWPFEVWNEPNLVPHFWTGTRTEYFELYEATVLAVKAIDSQLRVGGPSSSVFVPDARYDGEYHDRSVETATAEAPDPEALPWKPVWIHEFIAYCAERDLPIDFLSTHLYPTDFAFDTQGVGRAISRQRDATRNDLRVMKQVIADSPYPQAELHITEWSTSPSSRDRMHDTVFAATYIARAFLQSHELADSISYWTFTDVFEEGGGGIGPFHGGFGFVNEQGIHKPTFHAMAMLNRLGDRIALQTEHGVITRTAADAVTAVFFNYPDSMDTRSVGTANSYAQTRRLAGEGPNRRISHSVAGLRQGDVYRVEILDQDHGDVVTAWHLMGEPLNLSRQDVADLTTIADDLDHRTLTVDSDGVLAIDISLAPWAVMSIFPAH
ncbi:beta-xylosidase [Mycetocola manganoxydans]|uniref:Beta-xylosidase n=1 Tax=Mycetocola manganoxydans TaxID=699879 RepID=A0A3L6ZSU5_9MICO|nr:beta-xylosidase [Mycetocola manganoxydans]RLP70705.1 beta-xylosidase [Mycetocola manganoxydans]GHD48778.1 beta-xylosidase [Mycetocola manganoxydans]